MIGCGVGKDFDETPMATGPHPTDPARIPGSEDVAALYRQLRKVLEEFVRTEVSS